MARFTKTNADASRLIDAAQAIAAHRNTKPDGSGPNATPENLSRYAADIHVAILGQVVAGAWQPLGVVRREQMIGLRVDARLGNSLLGEAAIMVSYDFSRTKLPLLLVETSTPRQEQA